MAIRRLRNKKNDKEEGLPHVVNGENTILNALERVLEVAVNSELDDGKLQEAKAEFDFLAAKLSLSQLQAIIVAILIDYDSPVPTKRMANYLSIRNIRLVSNLNELKDLLERRIIRRKYDCHMDEMNYFISPCACQCYIRNEAYIPSSNENLGIAEFMAVIDDIIEQYDNNSLSKRELHEELHSLIEKNSTLHLCKDLQVCSPSEKILFLYCCHEYVSKGDCTITSSQYSDYFIRGDWAQLSSEISMGTSKLLQSKLLEHTSSDNMIGGNGITMAIAKEYRKYLSAELDLHWEHDTKVDHQPGLLQYETISTKQMFYNHTEKLAISQLTDLLQQEQFAAIQERLAEHGMRKGFACLFYGSPGTGKTETALQLAKATGRDIMQVNITDVKSKWVGESEQNIKGIFDSYRKYCKRCKTLWYNDYRGVLFQTLNYTDVTSDVIEGSIPKAPSEFAMEIIRKMQVQANGHILPENFKTSSEYKLFYFRAVQYWFKVLDREPIYEEDGAHKTTGEMKPIYVENEEYKNIIIAVLSSNLFFVNYIIWSSCQVVNSRDFNFFINFNEVSENLSQKLSILGKHLQEDYQANSHIKVRSYSKKGREFTMQKQHFYIKFSKPIIDEIDKLLAKHYAFTEEELDFIINYDIKYRMGDELNE